MVSCASIDIATDAGVTRRRQAVDHREKHRTERSRGSGEVHGGYDWVHRARAHGAAQAANLLKRGFSLVVHNRSQEAVDALVRAGAARAASPAEVARLATRIITMLPDSPLLSD